MPHIRGPFTVNMKPLAPPDEAPGGTFNRLSLEKSYEGELQAVALGQMLSVMTPVQGSAGYVAVERVTGTLTGRSGSFSLQHSGLLDNGAQSLTIHVIPDSASDELTGLRGQMRIVIEDGQHYYEFDYSLPE